jgi:nitrogenase molybdenum-iron protein NifN
MLSSQKPVTHTATQNACKLCMPLGACLVFKGIEGAVPLLHGSQGCSTYIRRYLISHYKEPVDIACSNFAEETAIFGGGANLKIALENIRRQYHPQLVGVASTCLSETIGDDVPMFIKEYRNMNPDEPLPPIVHVSTPSYQGTHMEGFHRAVAATVSTLATGETTDIPLSQKRINLFPGMVSPADLRHLKTILTDFGLEFTLLPDYSETLDGGLWDTYHRIPAGGTPVADIRRMGHASATVEFGRVLSAENDRAGRWLHEKFQVSLYDVGLPIGVRESDRFFSALSEISGIDVPMKYQGQRGRLLDAYVDGHKYVNGLRAVVYGEADLVVGMAGLLGEIGIVPTICATGDKNSHFKVKITEVLSEIMDKAVVDEVTVLDGVDFVDIEERAAEQPPDLIIGNSKGYPMARKLGVPLIRIGFPIHDRFGGARLLHLGYRGTQQLFDRMVNAIMSQQQDASDWGYTYM